MSRISGRKPLVLGVAVLVAATVWASFHLKGGAGHAVAAVYPYPIHSNISTTWFYVGEPADSDDRGIPNLQSAWDDHWQLHYGGVDSPRNRNGYLPAGFTPKQNPFYIALPYDDFTDKGSRKTDALDVVPWARQNAFGADDSYLKNRWVKISKDGRSVYAQWEDVGPFGEDDASYVFGLSKPKNILNDQAGLDVSPAVRDALSLSDLDTTDWQFVDAAQVPPGPWKTTVTTSQIDWN
jgi:hypothetical protein